MKRGPMIPLTLKQGEVERTYGRNPLKVERQYYDGVVKGV